MIFYEIKKNQDKFEVIEIFMTALEEKIIASCLTKESAQAVVNLFVYNQR